MKTCPSCASRLDDSLMSCPSCGYEYQQEASSRTIMGFPAVTFPPDAEPEEEDLGKQTLFGFPAQKASVESQFDESECEEEDDATHLIPAEDLQREFQDDLPQRAQVEEIVKPVPATSGAPNIKAAWGLEEDSDESKTAVVSLGSALNQTDEPAGFSLRQEEVEFPEHATLMGMNIADLEKKNSKAKEESDSSRSASTQFAMPAVQFDDPAVAPVDSGPISEDHGASTEMWNPSDEIPSDASPEQRALLEQLRSGKAPVESKRTTQESVKPGGQALPVGQKPGLVPAINVPNVDPADLRARLQAKLRNSSLSDSPVQPKAKDPEQPQLPTPEAIGIVSPSQPPKPQKDLSSQGVLGKSTYVISRQKEEGAETTEPKAPIAKLQLAQPPSSTPPPESAPEPRVDPHSILYADGDEDDFAFADTNVAPSELVEKIQNSAPARIDGSATDIFDSVPDEVALEEPVAQQTPQTRSSSFPEPSRPIIPTPYDNNQFAEVAPTPTAAPSPDLLAPPENSAVIQTTPSTIETNQSIDVDAGPIWLQRIPALLGALLLLVTGPIALIVGSNLAGYFAAGVFSLLGIINLGATFSGPPNLIRRTAWAIIGLVAGGFGLMVLVLQIAPISVGFPAFCGGLLTFGAAVIRTIYDRLPTP